MSPQSVIVSDCSLSVRAEFLSEGCKRKDVSDSGKVGRGRWSWMMSAAFTGGPKTGASSSVIMAVDPELSLTILLVL